MNKDSIETFDVVTVGGGLVGAIGALCLQQFGGAGFRQALVERSLIDDGEGFEKDPHLRPSGRAYALSESSRALLDVLGLWEAMAPFAQPIQEVDISDSDLESPFRPIFLNFSGEIEMGKLGAFIIEHEPLAAPIYKALSQAKSLKLYEQAQVVFKREAPWATIAHSVVFKPISNKVVDFKIDPFGGHIFYGVDLK